MVEVHSSGRTLHVGGRELQLRHPIDQVLEKEGMVIALLEAPAGTDDERNIVSYSLDGKLKWEIEPPGTSKECQPYMSLESRDDQLVTKNWNGYTYKIDLEDGSVTPTNYSSK